LLKRTENYLKEYKTNLKLLIMRKLMLTALAIVITTTTLMASNINPDESNKNIRSQIQKLFDVTEIHVNEDVTVEIVFTFDSADKIIVLKVDSTDSDVLKYVRENLNRKTISNPGIKDRHYTFPLALKKG
jgi:flagellar basal body-associated protein FliL